MLQTKQIGDNVVSEAGMREAVRRVSMIRKVQDLAEKEDRDEELIQALGIYPHIAGCITPVLSMTEFMQIPETVLDELSQAAMELNPHWFVTPEQEKKTKKKREKSSEKSETL